MEDPSARFMTSSSNVCLTVRWVLCYFPSIAAVLHLGLMSCHWVPCLILHEHGSCVIQERHGGSLVRWCWKIPVGIHHCPWSVFSVDCGTLQPVASLQIGPQLPWPSPYVLLIWGLCRTSGPVPAWYLFAVLSYGLVSFLDRPPCWSLPFHVWPPYLLDRPPSPLDRISFQLSFVLWWLPDFEIRHDYRSLYFLVVVSCHNMQVSTPTVITWSMSKYNVNISAI